MKLNIKIFSTNELKVTPDLELHDLKNLFSILINKGELNIKINRKDRLIFMKKLLNYLSKLARNNRVFQVEISNNKSVIKLTFFKKLIPFSKKYGKSELLKNIKHYEFNEQPNIEIGEAFYDCNFPEARTGCRIVELSEDIYKYVKIHENP